MKPGTPRAAEWRTMLEIRWPGTPSRSQPGGEDLTVEGPTFTNSLTFARLRSHVCGHS